MAVNAIETAYAGCRFRSRLEARWAVALDVLDFPWEYEPQGFDLPSGRYLPDFRVGGPDDENRFWIEIKGPMPGAREFQVATEINLYDAPLVIFSGDIPRRQGMGSAWVFGMDDNTWVMVTPEQALIRVICRSQDEADRPTSLGKTYSDALTAARSARFEHGEQG
jgi:hypothetical protein